MIAAIAAILMLLSPTVKTISGIAASVFAQGGAPGMAIAVVRDGKVVYSGGYGYADPASRAAATPQTRFAIGSLSKQFAAVSVLSLVQHGKLSLNDKVATFFPKLPNADEMTIRELLNQTSGLHNYPDTREHAWPLSGSVDPGAIIDVLATDKPDFAPGAHYAYSNSNYTVLAAIVQKVTGMPFAQYLQQSIFSPLGMSRSGYGYALQQTGDLAVPYVAGKPAPKAVTLDLYAGAGAIVSTASDMALWDEALLGGSLLDAQGMNLLFTPGRPADAQSIYGMGFIVDTLDGHPYMWHNGYAPGAGGYCYNAIFPQQHLAVVILTNGDISSEQGKPETLAARIFESYVPVRALQADPAITALAKEVLRGFQNGNIDRAEMTPSFSAFVTPAILAQAKAAWSSLGEAQSFTLTSTSAQEGATQYLYRVEFPDGVVKTVYMAIADGKVSGFTLR